MARKLIKRQEGYCLRLGRELRFSPPHLHFNDKSVN